MNTLKHHLPWRDARTPWLNSTGAAVVVVVLFCIMQGCAVQTEEKRLPGGSDVQKKMAPKAEPAVDLRASFREMPGWLDIYREKSLVNIASVDHVVIVTFETLGERDEVYDYYESRFGNEENFSSFRDGRDIISFVREGYGVKITLIDSTRNRWSLEYHRQAI